MTTQSPKTPSTGPKGAATPQARAGRPGAVGLLPLPTGVNAPEDRCVQRIVVGVDGSVASKVALRWAADIAGCIGAGLEVIRVWHYPPPYHEWDARPSSYGFLPLVPNHDLAERMARQELADTTVEVLGPEPAVPLTERVIQGQAADVLIEASTEAQLLVVGRRGHSGLAALLLGSVARACTEHAHCPVVVVPAGVDEPMAGEQAQVAIQQGEVT
jgi:nucleotide-binding universal stress UspA family protein